MRHIWLTLVLCLATSTAVSADFKDENLLQAMPRDYKIDFETRIDGVGITEMVPVGESVETWTEKLTTQIFFGMKSTALDEFQANVEENWRETCKGSESALVAKGVENGYTFSLWIMSCPLKEATGKPEITWFKAIRGNDSVYLVQKAFRFQPTEPQSIQWAQYLRRVTVCDTRLPDRSCPVLIDTRK
jgi:hypothetical protein